MEECVRALAAVPAVEHMQDVGALQEFARRMQIARSYVAATLSALIVNDEDTVKWGLANLRAHVFRIPSSDNWVPGEGSRKGAVRER